VQTTLIHFKCACGYEEPIGVDISVGIIIKGSITMVCPKCGAIVHLGETVMLSAVKFQPPQQAWRTP